MRKILIMLPNNLGDVIMALPVMRLLKKKEPDCHITYMVEPGYEDGLLGCPYCDHILFLPRLDIKAAVIAGKFAAASAHLYDMVAAVRHSRYDMTINLSQHPYLSYIATLSNAENTRGRRFLREGNHAIEDSWSQYLYAIPYSRTSNYFHATDVYSAIACGQVVPGDGRPTITLTDQEKEQARAYLVGKGCRAGRETIVILQPGAAYASKRWPASYCIELGTKLLHSGSTLLITGAPAERDAALSIAEKIGEKAIVTAGERSFRQTIALCAFTDAIVCGDTALMHAAAALGKKVYALFGPTNPVETGPYGSEHTVFAGECDKRPCFKTDCPTMDCMKSITPDTVYGYIVGKPGTTAACTVFTTGFSNDIWRLELPGKVSNPYYDEEAATITRKAFDPDGMISGNSGKNAEQVTLSLQFAQRCGEMEQALLSFMTTGDTPMLQRFSSIRNDAAHECGITAFWNALLNIRLNSIPLLDYRAGIEGSAHVCRTTCRQITSAVSS